MPLSGTLRGITAMLTACAFFACMDALLKALAAHYPPVQVTALRGLTSLPLVLLYVLWRREVRAVWGRQIRWKLHLMRGVIGVGMLALFAYGLRTLGLAEAYTLSFVAPMLIMVLAIPLLGETVQPRHWLAIGVGFVGVLVALRPSHTAFASAGALAILGSAVGYALFSVLGRMISRTEPSASLVLWTTVAMSVGGCLLAAWQWVPLQAVHTPLLLALALTGFLGQLAISEAFRHGKAAAVAPFEYSSLGWALLIDWVVWSSMPDGWTLGGAAIIIVSGIYLVRGEGRPQPAGAPVKVKAS